MAPGQRQFWYPWPYVEGLTMAEAGNDLAFLVTGAYGKPLGKSFGAPIRLAVPWKYGFKSIKSISKISFVAERPKTFWEGLQASEYGFWANVNPAVPHPRWSQATEEVLGTGTRQPTRIFNGYGDSSRISTRGWRASGCSSERRASVHGILGRNVAARHALQALRPMAPPSPRAEVEAAAFGVSFVSASIEGRGLSRLVRRNGRLWRFAGNAHRRGDEGGQRRIAGIGSNGIVGRREGRRLPRLFGAVALGTEVALRTGLPCAAIVALPVAVVV